jgi:hypothetical protein
MAYDLGVDGDYENLYLWLDKHSAIECGDSVAFLQFKGGRDIISDLRKSLKREVKLRPRDRIYVIYPAADGRYKGRFLFGGRKRSPWEGYAGGPPGAIDEPE